MYAVEDHVIRCNFSDIPAQIIGVIWTPTTTQTDGYTFKDGTFDPNTKSQVSTMTISSDRLVDLRGSAKSHTFGCEITVDSTNRRVVFTQTILIFNPSKSVVPIMP